MKTAVSALIVVLSASVPAYAQTADSRPLRRPEITVGGGLLGGASLGAADATLRANERALQEFRLFGAASDFGSTPSMHVRGGLGLSRRMAVEGGLTWSRPEIRKRIEGDVEGAAPLTVAEQTSQYFVDGSLVIMLDELRVGGGLVPFLAAGGGYLRQLHEGRTVVEQGQVYHAGGGAKYWLHTRGAGRIRATGLRGDVRAYFLRGGIDYGTGPRPHLAVSGSIFVNF